MDSEREDDEDYYHKEHNNLLAQQADIWEWIDNGGDGEEDITLSTSPSIVILAQPEITRNFDNTTTIYGTLFWFP